MQYLQSGLELLVNRNYGKNENNTSRIKSDKNEKCLIVLEFSVSIIQNDLIIITKSFTVLKKSIIEKVMGEHAY